MLASYKCRESTILLEHGNLQSYFLPTSCTLHFPRSSAPSCTPLPQNPICIDLHYSVSSDCSMAQTKGDAGWMRKRATPITVIRTNCQRRMNSYKLGSATTAIKSETDKSLLARHWQEVSVMLGQVHS